VNHSGAIELRAADQRFIGNGTKDSLRKKRGRSFECAVDYGHRNTLQRDWTQNPIDLRHVTSAIAKGKVTYCPTQNAACDNLKRRMPDMTISLRRTRR